MFDFLDKPLPPKVAKAAIFFIYIVVPIFLGMWFGGIFDDIPNADEYCTSICIEPENTDCYRDCVQSYDLCRFIPCWD